MNGGHGMDAGWNAWTEKKAQVSGFVPSYRYGQDAAAADAKAQSGFANAVAKGVGTGLGAMAGGAKWLWDKMTSEEAVQALSKGVDYDSNPFFPRAVDGPLGLHKSEDVLPLMDHVRAGAEVGEQPVTWKRLGSDVKTTAYGVGNDFFVVSDDKMNEVQRANDAVILDQMRSLGVPVPDNPPTDENGVLTATGLPEYEEYDEFVNSARVGQGVGRFGMGWAVPGAVTKGVAKGVRAVRSVARPAGALAKELQTAVTASGQAGKATRDANNLRNAASHIKPAKFGREAARASGQAPRARAGQELARAEARLAEAEARAAELGKAERVAWRNFGRGAAAEAKWNAAERGANVASQVATVGYPAAAGVYKGVEAVEGQNRKLKDELSQGTRAVLDSFGVDSEQYKAVYEKAKAAGIDMSGFPAPMSAAAASPQVNSAKGTVGRGATWSDWYNGMTDTGKAITLGAGGAGLGAILGSILGGKGGWWKWGLLGALLGALGGKGVIKAPWGAASGA